MILTNVFIRKNSLTTTQSYPKHKFGADIVEITRFLRVSRQITRTF